MEEDGMMTLLNMDSVAALETLAAGSVQLVVTSPPYDKLRTYGGHEWEFKETALQIHRVLVDGGVCCWNVNDSVVDGSETLTSFRQAIYFKDVAGFQMHDTMIYEKAGFSHPESVRYHAVFEYVFVLSKGKPRTFNPICDKRNSTAGRPALGLNTFALADGSRHTRAIQGGVSAEFGKRGNVWRGKTRGQEEMCESKPHPAMMPKWLARDLILSWSNPGDLVADPFAGSGTVGGEAISTGRRAWLNDINADYLPLCRKSCEVTQGLAIA